VKKILTGIVLALTLSACSNGAKLQSGDYADAATTAVGVALGHTEVNPLLGAAPDAAIPVAALGFKYAVKAGMIEAGYPVEQANKTVNSVSWGAACHNLVILAGGPHPIGIAAGIGCWFLTK